MSEVNRDFAKEDMRVVARELGKAAKEALPEEVKPAVEAFLKGFHPHQRRQEQPKYYPTRRLYMEEERTKTQGLTAARAELSDLQAQTEQGRIPYKDGVLVPLTPEQQQSNQQWIQEQHAYEFNKMRSQWEAEEHDGRLTRLWTKDKTPPAAHLPEYFLGNPQKSPDAAVQRLIGATPQEYEAITGSSTGSFAEHVRSWGTSPEARADRAHLEPEASSPEPQEESGTQPSTPEETEQAA